MFAKFIIDMKGGYPAQSQKPQKFRPGKQWRAFSFSEGRIDISNLFQGPEQELL